MKDIHEEIKLKRGKNGKCSLECRLGLFTNQLILASPLINILESKMEYKLSPVSPNIQSFEDGINGDQVLASSFDNFGYPEADEYDHHDLVAGSPGQGQLPIDLYPYDKPRILIMGLRRSGKSSIQKVVFHKMSPNETLFLESTNKIVKDEINNSSFVSFTIWDFPGQIDFFDDTFDSDQIFSGCGALVFVIDAQDDYMEALTKLTSTVTKAWKVNREIKFEIFIHKVDGLSEDHKIETQRDIQARALEELGDFQEVNLSFYLTSIYDHSIFEAFSKVVQKLIPQLPTLENLLNIFISVTFVLI